MIADGSCSPYYVGFVDGAIRWSPNLASTAWVLYSPSHELIHLDGVCIGVSTNNQVEYDDVTGLLTAAL
jgi:ribonuclease HI